MKERKRRGGRSERKLTNALLEKVAWINNEHGQVCEYVEAKERANQVKQLAKMSVFFVWIVVVKS